MANLKEHWHIVELLTGQERSATDRALKVLSHSNEHYHRMLLLTAAIVAFVPPLFAQSSLPINRWFIQRGILTLFGTITIGIVTLAFSRTSLVVTLRGVDRQWERLGRRVGFAVGAASADDEVDSKIAEAYDEHGKEQLASVSNRHWGWIVGTLVGWDLLFHGSFLYGVWCLFRAAYI